LAAGDDDYSLGQRLERINVFLNERTGGEKYATVFYCLLERGGGLRYVNAGHCPPILARPGCDLEWLPATAAPVGLLEHAAFELQQRALAAGDKLVIYTDGVSEAQNEDGEFFGKQRLRQAIAEHCAVSCQALHDGVQEAVAAFTGGAPQADDVTLVVLEYGG
jgi:sigma-B regulation protein RsbU (phosphoserine phosphatase)